MQRLGEPTAKQDSTTLAAHPHPVVALAQTWQDLLQAYQPIFKQRRSFMRFVLLALGLIFAFARRTLTQTISALGQDQTDWSGWYRLLRGERFDEASLWQVFVKHTLEHVPAEQPYLAAIDTTAIWRSSATLPGSAWTRAAQTAIFRPGLRHAQRFLTCAWIPGIVRGFSRAIPIRMLPAFTSRSAPAEDSPCTAWEAGLRFITWLRQQLNGLGRDRQPVVVLADGAFDQVGLWRALPEGVVLVTRTAKNRVLHELPPQPSGGRGRRRKYGARVPSPQQHLHDRAGWRQVSVEVRGRLRVLRYKVVGPVLRPGAPERPLFLLVIRGQSWHKRDRRRTRQPVYYLLNAAWNEPCQAWHLPMPIEFILQAVWQRWEIEVTHRAMKTSFGVGQMQCWHRVSAVLSVQTHVWVFSTLMLAAYRAWGWFDGRRMLTAWYRSAQRWTFNAVLQQMRAELWKLDEFRAQCSASAATWAKIPQSCLLLVKSALSCSRG